MSLCHKYCSSQSFSKISPYLQGKMLLMGQHTNYQEGATLLKDFLGIEISSTQLFRLTNHYGEVSGEIMQQDNILAGQNDDRDIVYAQCDGLMILTREPSEDQSGSWQEVKLCRVYRCRDMLSSGKRHWINHSDYVAHIGSHKEFQVKAEYLTDRWEHLAEHLVFISDGAPWIHRWQTDHYPQATQILDYYHVVEHLSAFASGAISDDKQRKKWLGERKEELLTGSFSDVIREIEDCARNKSTSVKKQKDKLIKYYRKNSTRMDYKSYLERGLQIGSDAIEAAHRNVIQKRLKLSGQRWTVDGAQNVLNLRTCYMSDRWDKVIELIRKPAA